MTSPTPPIPDEALIADLSDAALIELLRAPSSHRVFDPKAVYATLDREILRVAADRLAALAALRAQVEAQAGLVEAARVFAKCATDDHCSLEQTADAAYALEQAARAFAKLEERG